MNELSDRLKQLTVRGIRGSYAPLSESQVVEVERRLGTLLPADYKDFILLFGDCTFDYTISVRVDGSEDVPVDWFFGAPRSDEHGGDLFWCLDGEFEPPGFMQIGGDLLGNVYVLDAVTGRVFYRNFYAHDGELELVAASFTDLLDRMYVVPRDEGVA